MSAEDQLALKDYVTQKLKKNNMGIIQDAAADNDLNNLARELEMWTIQLYY